MILLHREVPWKNPADVYTILRGNGPSFLLESPGGNIKTSRYSFIGTNPGIIIKSKGKKISVQYQYQGSYLDSVDVTGNPFEYLRGFTRGENIMVPPGFPPFIGGFTGYCGYDMVHHLERLPSRSVDDLNLPDMAMMRSDIIVAFDHLSNKCWLIGVCREEGYEETKALMESVEENIRDEIRVGERRRTGKIVRTVSNMTRKEYIEMVQRCKEYIAAGDIFQANLSQRFSAYVGDMDPFDIYMVLREINPSPFSAFIDTGDFQIVSSSPERLVKFMNGVVETRPIAGTRRRGRSPQEDDRLAKELISNEKECAEHVMLIDLERNDLGKICKSGTIEVDEFMVLESYSHVTHIVSNIRGCLAEGKDAVDIIMAMFPGGTITGVPKIRCMEIIDELEPTKRGPYTGSIGYISYSGNIDFNIIIRSFIIRDGWAHVQVGAGIVADSDPDREYEETLYKAEALLKTLEAL